MWVGVVGSWGRGRHVSGVRVRSTEEEPRVAVSHGSGARGAPRETGLSVAGSRKVCVRVCGWGGRGGMASARRRRGSWELGVAALLTFGPGSVTRQTLAVKQPTTFGSRSCASVSALKRVGLSHAPSQPNSLTSLRIARVGLRPSAVGQHHSHRIDAQASPPFS